MLIIQADGASKGNPGPASFGVAIFTSDGELVAEVFEAIGVATNNQAEYRAVLAGLRAAVDLLPSHGTSRAIHIQMDSKLVIEQLAGRWKIKNSELQQLAMQAQQLMREFEVKLEWIPRERNAIADGLANRALLNLQGDSTPSAIASIQPKSIRAPRQSVEPTVVWAIRHGHTQMTEGGLISGGGADPSLSDFGKQEAARIPQEIKRLAQLFSLQLPEVIIHSPQLRARQTAEMISEQLFISLQTEPRLREIEFGDWEGVSMDSLVGISQPEIDQWRGSTKLRPPGGESVADLERRVSQVLKGHVNSGQASVALVAHMMPMRAIYRGATGATESAHWGVNFNPASVSVYRFFGETFAEVFAVNSTAHLEPLQKSE